MSPRPTALFVEDDEAILEALSALLDAHGYDVTPATTAEQALEHLRSKDFSLLVTDYTLPGQSGEWLVSQAREGGLLNGTVTIMVTALLRPPRIEDVKVLPKPIDVRRLLEEARRPVEGTGNN